MLSIVCFAIAIFSILVYSIVAVDRNSTLPTNQLYKDKKPFVSILIALRNEAANVPSLCESLKGLDYPIDSYEILFCDDASTDRTLELLEKCKPLNAKIVGITPDQSTAYGKLNALKKLSQIAKGDFLLFTDADVVVNPDWISGMIYKTGNTPQMQLGITTIKGQTLFAQLQNADWVINQRLIQWISERFTPVTAWGNNMSMDKGSFERIAGYDGIDDSIVEDVELMQKVKYAKGNIRIVANTESSAQTLPCQNLGQLIQQRDRWMVGTKNTPVLLKTCVIIKLAFLPAVICSSFWMTWFLLLIPLKGLLLYFISNRICKEIQQPLPLRPYLFYDIYEFVVYFMTFVVYLLPVKTIWKGRKY